jgi:ubiquinone/menaquinone biosynthesis C-methylase UbiE
MMDFAAGGRSAEIEILDAGGYAEEEIRGNLADLRFYNAWFAGSRIAIRAVARLLAREDGAAPRRLSLLDVATGSGDIPAAVATWLSRRGVDALTVGADANAQVLEEARRCRKRGMAPVSLLAGDACRLPHPDRSVDIVICCNFLHHLDANAAVGALREMARVARAGVVAVDLIRTRTAWLNVWLLTRLTTLNRLTRHDGPLSVRRAFVPRELVAMAAQAGMRGAVVRRAGPVRMVLTCRTTP